MVIRVEKMKEPYRIIRVVGWRCLKRRSQQILEVLFVPITTLLKILSGYVIKWFKTVLKKYSAAQTSTIHRMTQGNEVGQLQIRAGIIFRGIRGRTPLQETV